MYQQGRKYEDLAEAYLLKNGHTIKAKNYHTRKGEIDLITMEGDTLVFIEVRYRKSAHFGSAEESVTPTKQAKIIYSARHFINKFKLWHLNARFDVVTIKPSNRKLEVNWLKGAFYQ